MPEAEEEYLEIDCLDPVTRKPLPLKKEVKPAKEKKEPDGFFVKLWNALVKFLLALWLILKENIMKIIEKIKKGDKK